MMRILSNTQYLRCLRGAALAAFALTSTAAGAQVRPGSRLTFTGVADALDVGRAGVLLDFQTGATAATSGNTGSFSSLNRRTGSAVSGSIADFIVGQGPQPIASFLQLGGYRFDLLSLPRGIFGQSSCYVAPAAEQYCTPYQSALGDPQPTDLLSPFFMRNVATGDPAMPLASVIAFNMIGTVANARGTTSSFFGTISSTLPFSYQEVLLGLEQAGSAGMPLPAVPFTGVFYAGFPIGEGDDGDDDRRAFASGLMTADAYAARAQVVTPEPATVGLLAVGLAAVGFAGARRRRG
jgi:hypothetical protein